MRITVLLVILATLVLNALSLPSRSENLSQPVQDPNAGQHPHEDPAPGPAPAANTAPAPNSPDNNTDKSKDAAPALSMTSTTPSSAPPTSSPIPSATQSPAPLAETKPPSIVSPSLDYAINGPAPAPAPGPQTSPRDVDLWDACNAAIDRCKPAGPNGQQDACCGWDGTTQHTVCILAATKARCAHR